MTTLWDTTGTAVVQALAAERRTGGAVTSGLALTLVVVLEEKDTAEVEAAVATAAAKHPMRVIMVLRHNIDAPVPRLDAEVSIGGRYGPGESVVLRMFGRLALHAESVTLPLLAPDAPVVAWWYSETPKVIAHDPLGVFADRRITNVIRDADPAASLRQRAVDFAPGDTDLTWTVITPWRAALAVGLRHRLDTGQLGGGVGQSGGPVRAAAGRLAVVPAGPGRAGGEGRGQVHLRGDGELRRRPGGADDQRGLQAADAPARPGATPSSRSRSGPPATCWPRSCAGWTPTSRTPRRSARCPG